MTKQALIVFFFVFSSLLFGQLDSNTVTVTASASTSVPPDQAVFGVYVNSGLNASLDDVLAALKTSGITAANFSGVTTNIPNVIVQGTGSTVPVLPQPSLQWAFGLPVPFTQMKATIALLTALQQSVAQANNGMTVSFQVAGSQVSAAARQAQGCNVVELIADATSQAQKVASAANLVVGPILALSSGTSTPGPASVGFVSFALVGSVGSGIGTTPQQTCAVTVKFSLLKF